MALSDTRTPIRVALVTSGYLAGGGVPAVVNWLANGLESSGLASVAVHDLAASSRDDSSRRIAKPRTWRRDSIRQEEPDSRVTRWGANAVEFEFMRYHARSELTEALNEYELVQVVAGTPALGWATRFVTPPVVAQVATRAAWEREAVLRATDGARHIWLRSMTEVVSRIENRTVSDLDGMLVENPAMYEYAKPRCRGLVEFAPPGVDTARFCPKPGSWTGAGYLLSLCRLGDPRKGLDRMLDAYRKLIDLDASVPRLLIAGRGPFPNELMHCAKRLGISSRVDFEVDIDPRELPNLYRNASAFLQTSFEEGFGLSAVEAMASGLPTICSETEGSRVTLGNHNSGYLIAQHPAGTFSTRFAAAVLDVLERSGPSMAQAARNRAVTEFSTKVALVRFLEMYKQLL